MFLGQSSIKYTGAGEENRTPVYSMASCCSTIELHLHLVAGVTGFEPVKCRSQSPVPYRLAIPQEMVEEDRFELPNPKEQIYSLPRLATSLLLHVKLLGLKNGGG